MRSLKECFDPFAQPPTAQSQIDPYSLSPRTPQLRTGCTPGCIRTRCSCLNMSSASPPQHGYLGSYLLLSLHKFRKPTQCEEMLSRLSENRGPDSNGFTLSRVVGLHEVRALGCSWSFLPPSFTWCHILSDIEGNLEQYRRTPWAEHNHCEALGSCPVPY